MYNEITFGKCLKFFLSTFSIRMNQLAKAINVDNSLVSLWANEKRLPSAQYIEGITEYMFTNITNSLQTKLIDELFNSLATVDTEVKMSDKEKIYKMLLSSLNYSLTCKKQHKQNIVAASITANAKGVAPKWNSIDLSSDDKLIYGIQNLFCAGLSLLEIAKHYRRRADNIIYLTYHNILDAHYFTEENLNNLRNVLLETIDNGWEIVYLLRLDNNIEVVIKFINFMLPLIQTGKVNLYYFTNYESFMVRKELYIVSGIGALSCFPTDAYSGVNCAFFLKNKSAVATLTNYAKLLISNNSDHIIKYYNDDTKNEFFLEASENNIKCGNQFSYNGNLSQLLISEELYKKLIEQTDLNEQEKILSIFQYKKQRDLLFKNLLYYVYKDIYFISTLERLCKDKKLYIYTYTGIKIVSIDASEAIEYLKYALSIIQKYNNFHIAMVFPDINNIIKNMSMFIKERRAVYIYVFELTNNKSDICLSITNPVIVKAFVEYYNALWGRISPLHKDKEELVAIVESYMSILLN